MLGRQNMGLPLTPNAIVSLDNILYYEDRISFVLGSSRSGKTTFLQKIVECYAKDRKIFLIDSGNGIETNHLALLDVVNVLKGVDNFSSKVLKTLPKHSLIIVDDFQLGVRGTNLEEFKEILNFCAHHYHLSIFLAVHSHLHSNGLHYAINNSINIYLTYSNNSRSF